MLLRTRRMPITQIEKRGALHQMQAVNHHLGHGLRERPRRGWVECGAEATVKRPHRCNHQRRPGTWLAVAGPPGSFEAVPAVETMPLDRLLDTALMSKRQCIPAMAERMGHITAQGDPGVTMALKMLMHCRSLQTAATKLSEDEQGVRARNGAPLAVIAA